jgi:hypothetical protein
MSRHGKIRSRSALLAAASLCLLSLGLGSAGSAAAAGRAPASLYWGAQIGREEAPWKMNGVYKFQSKVGKGMSLIEFSSPFADCSSGSCQLIPFPGLPLENIRSYGAIPVFSWSSASSPASREQPDFQLSDILSGRYDAFIHKFALAAKTWGHPFFLRFDWEMNGFWFPWNEGVNGNQKGEYVAVWRHVHDIFTQVGATNVSWVWCPNVDLSGALVPLGSVYPGDKYVDWTAIDGFNWGDRRGSPGWQTFDEVFHSTYKRIVRKVAPRKPMMLAEVASSDRGGSKAAWIKNMLNEVRHNYRKIRAVIWYDTNDRGANWPLGNNNKPVNAFRTGIAPGSFKENVYGGLQAAPAATVGGAIPPPPRRR